MLAAHEVDVRGRQGIQPNPYQLPTDTDRILHQVSEALSRAWKPALIEGLPQVFTGGWVGYAG